MELTPKQAPGLVELIQMMRLERARADEAFQRFLAVAFYRYV